MKVGIIVGTRPEIIKMAPVIRECQRRNLEYFIIHSNQHYSKEMDSIFFDELKLPKPHYNLGVGSGLHSNQTGNILIKIEPILEQELPDVVLVQGDTNTVLAGALAASKLNIKVGHIEAGLRSYDRMMPEETNRILTDHMSDFLFAVGPNQEQILNAEGIAREKVFTVGNTVSDSLFQHLELSAGRSQILDTWQLTAKQYFLVTAHRASNVDIKSHLQELLLLFNKMYERYQKKIFWPIHPRTMAKIEEYQLNIPEFLKLSPPVGYMDFIQLQKSALLILTDSGGIQEEACLLGVPCITLRENTERPESVEVGANILVGRDAEKAITAAATWLEAESPVWQNPFGDGNVAKRIFQILSARLMPASETIVANNMAITVVGMGYMGLPIACLMAEAGIKVTGVDLNAEKVRAINNGQSPFEEKDLPKLVTKVVSQGFLTASREVVPNPVYLIAVPTPQKESHCDLSFVLAAVDGIARVAKNDQTVIIESTISPGTCRVVEQRFEQQGLRIHVVHCPERAIPGQTLYELKHNDRIIGCNSSADGNLAKDIYQSFVTGDIFITDTTTAECIKLVENTSRDVNIAFANELAEVCQELQVDVFEVINLANRHPRVNILTPGPGVGGHCIPIDPWFLVEQTQSGSMIRLARQINDQKPAIVATQVIDSLNLSNGKKVGILGVAYKANVDDCRETPAAPLLSILNQNGIEVRFHDPYVHQWQCAREDLTELDNWADLLVLITDHQEYKSVNLTTHLLNTRA
ncbi:non-hydrolyzing UDP-N-acetylglucosamine 2-epimerase [Thalassotalea sp. ND16A]|uniref:non-hydrolyzing UDP-N-acetylglucosamine 2-epimerase n=1 Tax=Thalassotalea sp. ND16A TaxID=1535422 RepID=UPI00051A0331|nr:UDP-N-acetylglucosamine 2-epimerase (non-hydrolyzing) [Thalassotalea sp. ND16A]KGJ95940.1 UDP-N-acetylglucosamine 2-epimerase, UDP-glucose 6-dehydrogenase [Thalassotalea sp. ND16A]